VTKKPDNRRDPDEDEVENAQRNRIDRVYIPSKRDSSGPAIAPPPPAPLRPPRSQTPSHGSPSVLAAANTASETEAELRRQLSKLQRSLADVQRDLANTEEQLAGELDRRAAQGREHEQLLVDHELLSARFDEVTAATTSRIATLEADLEGVVNTTAALARERDELVRQRDELAQLRDKETRLRDDEARQRAEVQRERDELAVVAEVAARARDEAIAAREALLRERDVQLAELTQRVMTLEGELSDTHKQWATERKEVVEEQQRELAAMDDAHKVALDAAVVAAKAAEVASAGIAVATVKAEADRDRQQLQTASNKLRDDIERVRGDAATELARLRESHDAAIGKLQASHSAELTRITHAHAASLDQARTDAQRAIAAAAEKHKQDLAQVVFNNAADQGVMARKHNEALQRAEARYGELEHTLADVRRDIVSRDAVWEGKLRDRDAAIAERVEQLAAEVAKHHAARAEIAELKKQVETGEAVAAELVATRARVEASEARLADLRAKLLVYFEKGIDLVEG
jgi:hypothetical protein